MSAVFETKRVVKSSDIDDLNHVNNVAYIQWMDDVAFAHWSELTKEYPLPEYIWVVVRHEVDYLRQAQLGDEITVKTWVGDTKGFKSERHMEFYKDGVLYVKAKTVWGMLNAKTYKPTRIGENVLKVLLPSK